jgi:hypothetical protein
MANIFVSYTSRDSDWAIWIAEELKSLGHVPRVYELEISGGADIYAWMESAHNEADHVLCLISDEALRAPYSTLERRAAAFQAAEKRPGFILQGDLARAQVLCRRAQHIFKKTLGIDAGGASRTSKFSIAESFRYG